ncbi:MAG TPA: GAF domain-containing protein, partial [Methylomirabilota bacterium]|nr:GAF domain-containing protein [Methylomirabilota bacterium]
DVTGRRFTADEAQLLQAFADQAALALENARLYAEATRRQREAEELARVARMLTGSLDMADLGQRIVDSVLPLFAVSSARLCLRHSDDSLEVVASSGKARAYFQPGHRYPPRVGVVGRALAERRPVWCRDVLVEPQLVIPDDGRRYVEETGDNAVLAVPFMVKGAIIGALILNDHAGREFSDAEIGLLQTFADQAALALDNARLYDETRRRLRHVDSLREAVEQILVPFSLEERLNLIARKAAELFDAERATIALRREGSEELVVRAGYRLTPGEVGRVLQLGTGGLGVAAAGREGVLVNDYESWPQRDPYIVTAYADRPPSAVLAYPLLVHDQVIGAIAVGLHAPGRRFAPADLDRLASLAAPAALVIEHSRLYDELQARLAELQATQAQLLQADKLSAVGRLVSGVAHELNNPLSVVIGYGQLLMSREVPPDIRRPLELMVAQGDRMARIVQSLLLFSRQRQPERGAVDIREMIEQTVALRLTQLALSGIRVERTFADGLPPVEGDAHQLQQVILNLLLNAEQAILGSGEPQARVGDKIRIGAAVRAEADGRWVVIEMEDNGPGIPRDALPRIFDPFFTTKKMGEGTGLGLSVSYGILRQHGGRLSCESAPGRTLFTLTLPAMTAPVASAGEPAAPPRAEGRGRRVLVVDDEPALVDLVSGLLRDRGWEVDVAGDGRAGLERLREGAYDLVVCDIRMPDLSGEEFYRIATSGRRDLARRFLFITGDTANPAAWHFIEQTQVPVLEKPFTPQALLRAIEQVAS